jgi:hypothetical protein
MDKKIYPKTWEIYRDPTNQWRWRLTASSGLVLAAAAVGLCDAASVSRGGPPVRLYRRVRRVSCAVPVPRSSVGLSLPDPGPLRRTSSISSCPPSKPP